MKFAPAKPVAIGAILALGALIFMGTQSARADDSQPHPTESAHFSPQPSEQQFDDDYDVQSQLEKKYGGKRDIATPPLLVKQSSIAGAAANSTKTYVAQPLDVAKGQLNPDANQDKSQAQKPKVFNIDKNQPVIKTITSASFTNPADEFARWAYLAMGLTAAAALAFFGLAFARRR